jgi:predicted CXXCH cytochrome family protein
MAPGFDRADNDGVTRLVRRECLFCHNAYPDVAAGSDMHTMPQVFPASLPEGTGCQRCHGPGGAHVDAAMSGKSDNEVRAAIVNPAKLPPPLRDSVCAQCHLQPAVAMIGPRRFERGDYSFRPGELLDDYMLHVDIDEAGRTRDQRFEINHHFYRLRQSACYIKGGITCISCHDPHQPLKKDRRLANVTSVCLGCHKRHNDSNECVTCHMPSRRTQDVVHVVMTDHRIQRRPPPGDLLAPFAERDPAITDVHFLNPDKAPTGALADVYRDVTVLRVMPQVKAAADQLAKRIDATTSPVPRFDLINAFLQQRRYTEALEVIASAPLTRWREWRGLAKVGLGRSSDGLADLQAAADAEPNVPGFQLNLGAILHQQHRDNEALAPLTRAIELRPNFAAALIMRAQTLIALDRRAEALADLRRALAIDPRQTLARDLIASLQAR